MSRYLLILLLILSIISAYAQPVERLYVRFAENFPTTPKQRIYDLLQKTSGVPVEWYQNGDFQNNFVLLSFGDNATTREIIAPQEWQKMGSEGFVVRSKQLDHGKIFAAVGNFNTEKNIIQNNVVNQGTLYASYALLEELGMAFLHPLEPTLPEKLDFSCDIDIAEKPYWPIRAWHLHTQHPIELTDMLNGWGPQGPKDYLGWQSMLPEWDLFLEWCVANKQNRVEWFLLMAASWQEFADSRERQDRLHKLVDMAHQWGIAVGIDAPIVFRQQHAWIMIRKVDGKTEEAQIHQAIDWLHTAGFDFFEIEMGFSEFTHPSGTKMLDWMDSVTKYADEAYGKRVYVKVHCSQHQKAKEFKDPETGEPLNFNFLPYYADARLGVLPHTVQYYSLTDPALTYGNQNFSEIRRYMQLEAGRREVVWYPETAYWVSYDINVPLFLPIYADRRLYDLRLIASDELEGKMGRGEHAGSRIQGQVNFSSGWEWGYWLNDVVTARGVWNPHMDIQDHRQALHKALQPITKVMGASQEQVTQALMMMIDAQEDLLVYGKVNGKAPKTYEKLTGMAYIQGFDTWMDMSKLIKAMAVCPDKKSLIEMRDPVSQPAYDRELKPLLHEMEQRFTAVSQQFAGIQTNGSGQKLLHELKDATLITSLRAKQVYNLYEMVNEIMDNILDPNSIGKAPEKLAQARRCLDNAKKVVERQEQRYRVDTERIASWRYNPTAYHYGYLWTARSLVYWWRDEGKALDAPMSPGYLNFMDPIDIANGEGEWIVDKEIPGIGGFNITQLRRKLVELLGNEHFVTELLTKPTSEPKFPQGDLRERPEWCPEW